MIWSDLIGLSNSFHESFILWGIVQFANGLFFRCIEGARRISAFQLVEYWIGAEEQKTFQEQIY